MNARRYHRALAQVEAAVQRESARIPEMCRTRLLVHERRAPRTTVFLHGLTASPGQFAWLAQWAFLRGDNVLVPRLPRHGHANRMTETLRDLRASELTACVERSLAIAADLGTTVRVVGFSLGGLLAAWAAQHHAFDEAIAIAPLLGIANVSHAFTPFVTNAARRLPNAFVWWNPRERERQMPAHGYPRFSTRAVAEALTIAAGLRADANCRAPRSPVLLVTNAGELAVNNAAVADLARRWRASGHDGIGEHRLGGLGPSHDIIEPLAHRANVDRTYPLILPLLDRTPSQERSGVSRNEPVS
jgi:alpha-beta hydrolase superfamily lysophospholipase